MKTPPDTASFPLSLEFIEWQSGKSLVRAPAAAALANEQMAVLNPNLLCSAVCARDLLQLTVLE